MADDRNDPQFKLRMPAKLKADLELAASLNKRSLTSEIVDRLEQSLDNRLTSRETKYLFHLADGQRLHTKRTAAWADMTMHLLSQYAVEIPKPLLSTITALHESIQSDAEEADKRYAEVVKTALSASDED